MIAIAVSRARVRLAGSMIRTGWAIIEAEETRWLKPRRPAWRVPNTRAVRRTAEGALAGVALVAAITLVLMVLGGVR